MFEIIAVREMICTGGNYLKSICLNNDLNGEWVKHSEKLFFCEVSLRFEGKSQLRLELGYVVHLRTEYKLCGCAARAQ